MLPTFLDWHPIFILQAAINRHDISRPFEYTLEAIINVIEAFLLSEEIYYDLNAEGLHLPVNENFFKGKYSPPFLIEKKRNEELNKKVLDMTMAEGLPIVELISFARAYNGEYGDVAVKMTSQEKKFIEGLFPPVTEEMDSKLEKALIMKAYNNLVQKYKIKIDEFRIKNKTNIVLPPLVSIFLSRLPDNCISFDIFYDELIRLREELQPTRRKFIELEKSLESKELSLKEMENIHKSIEVDAEYFAKKWNSQFTENTIVQFALDNISFLYKLIIKREPSPEDALNIVSKIAPGVERRFSATAPTILSKLALKTKHIKGIMFLLDKKLDIKYR